MAKIFRISGYLVDPDGLYSLNTIESYLDYIFDGMIHQHVHIKEADIGKWDDESPLNYDNCDLAECEKYFKCKVPVDNDRNVMAGQIYRHFKGQTVKVLHISQDTEAPGQFYVVYECEDGAVWSRPYGMFAGEVDHEKYPDVKQKYRFELVKDVGKEEFGKWIPCSERMPEPGQYVLVSFANELLELPAFASYIIDEDGNGAFYPDDQCVTYSSIGAFVNAWMPLPEPYREVE